MIKKLISILLFCYIPVCVYAQPSSLESNGSAVVLARTGAVILQTNANQEVIINPNASSGQSGLAFTCVSNICSLLPRTSDATDNYTIQLGFSNGARGAGITLPGEEVAGGGDVIFNAGVGDAHLFNVNGTQIASIDSSGVSLGGSGNFLSSISGGALSLQEATSSTACMGAATPNGNTPVAVTTSCALTGARVFYTRAGAITNMGVITTTSAPNGTGFSFASTGASDTLASSVIYMIVKESA